MSLSKNPRYDLKRSYKRIFHSSIIVSLFVVIAAFKYAPEFKTSDTYTEPLQDIITVEDIASTIQDNHVPPPPRPFVPIEAPGDLDVSDIIIGDTDLNPDANITTIPPHHKDDDPEPTPDFIAAVEEPPAPIGGLSAIEKNIVYPELARRAGIQGSVNLLAYVDEEGNVVKVEIVKGIGGGCDEAAIDAVMKIKFQPGMQRGKPVKVRVGLPIKFRLK